MRIGPLSSRRVVVLAASKCTHLKRKGAGSHRGRWDRTRRSLPGDSDVEDVSHGGCNHGVGRDKVCDGRLLHGVEAVCRVQDADQAGGGLGMPIGGLCGGQEQRVGATGAQHRGGRIALDGVTCWVWWCVYRRYLVSTKQGAGAVHLQLIQGPRLHARSPQCCPEHLLLRHACCLKASCAKNTRQLKSRRPLGAVSALLRPSWLTALPRNASSAPPLAGGVVPSHRAVAASART